MPAENTIGTNSHLLTESVISLREAAKEIPNRPHFSTVWRWARRGVGGVRLETYKIGSQIITSRQAIHRFLEGVNGN